jgi:AraC-like DNA-binding protein
LYRSVFTTEGLTEEERVWAMTAALDAAVATTPLSSPMRVELQGYMLGPISLIVADCSPRRTERTAAKAAADGYDSLSVQLTLAGRASGSADGRPVETGPGDLLFLSSRKPFLITDREPRRGVTAGIPRSAIRTLRPTPAQLHGLVLGPERNRLLAEYLRALPALLPTLPNASGGTLARVLLDLLNLTLEPLRTGPVASNSWPSMSTADAALVARAHAFIDGNLTDPELSPERLAALMKISRSRLYKLFGATAGVSQHIWSRRLAAVHAALLDPLETRSISEIALHWGFGSETAFARAFRAAYGVTASELRRRAHGE